MQYRTYAFFQQEFATKNTITEKKDIAVAKDGIERTVDERWGQIVALTEDGHTFLADFKISCNRPDDSCLAVLSNWQ